jgi:Protein of unknown function (DUF3079)
VRRTLACGTGCERTQHPSELFADDQALWGPDSFADEGSGAHRTGLEGLATPAVPA